MMMILRRRFIFAALSDLLPSFSTLSPAFFRRAPAAATIFFDMAFAADTMPRASH